MQTEPQKQPPNKKKVSLLAVIASVMAAFFGVQSQKNKERDFNQGNHKVFIIVAAILTLLFIATLFAIVQLVTR